MSEIPEDITSIILLFYCYSTINSEILTNEETDKLLQLFDEYNKFKHLGNYSCKWIS